MKRGHSQDRNRAVSDLAGFAVVFGIVVVSVALVFTFGTGALSDVQRGEAVENVDRAFDIVSDNLEDIHRNGAPARSTELDIGTGQVELTGSVSITVNTNNSTSTTTGLTPIGYAGNENQFHYVSGAVIRTSRDSSVIVRQPPFRFDEDRVVISFVTTVREGDTTSLSGSSVRLRAQNGGTSVDLVETGGVTLNLSVQSPRYQAWGQYFENEIDCVQDPTYSSNNTAVCQYETEQLYVRDTFVDVSLTE